MRRARKHAVVARARVHRTAATVTWKQPALVPPEPMPASESLAPDVPGQWMLEAAVKPLRNPIPLGVTDISVKITDPATGELIGRLPLHATVMAPNGGPVEHPEIVETSPGIYRFQVNFPRRGHWRVLLQGADAEKGAVSMALNFQPGSNTPWVQDEDLDE